MDQLPDEFVFCHWTADAGPGNRTAVVASSQGWRVMRLVRVGGADVEDLRHGTRILGQVESDVLEVDEVDPAEIRVRSRHTLHWWYDGQLYRVGWESAPSAMAVWWQDVTPVEGMSWPDDRVWLRRDAEDLRPELAEALGRAGWRWFFEPSLG